MKTCDICNTAETLLILTRHGLRCGPCLRGEYEVVRKWLEAFVDLHVRDGNDEGEMARSAYRELHGKAFEP